MIDSFTGKYRFLSNFYLYDRDEYFIYDGISYISNEHLYQAMKFEDINIRKLIAGHKIGGLKKFVKAIEDEHRRKDWLDISIQVMEIGLRYKFSLLRFKKLLLETGDEELIEGNTWGDTFWGVYNGVGENHLGKLLMKIRKEIKEKI